jgi:hypothetical protein
MKDEPITVIVTKPEVFAIKSSLWYSDCIGEHFKVVSEAPNSDWYKLIESNEEIESKIPDYDVIKKKLSLSAEGKTYFIRKEHAVDIRDITHLDEDLFSV